MLVNCVASVAAALNGSRYPNTENTMSLKTKQPGQQAYEKHCEFQLRIPRMEIRPLTWEELGQCSGDLQSQWHEIARVSHEAHADFGGWNHRCNLINLEAVGEEQDLHLGDLIIHQDPCQIRGEHTRHDLILVITSLDPDWLLQHEVYPMLQNFGCIRMRVKERK
jgi:hypothetical protein